MPDKSYNIDIRTEASGSGAKDATAGLDATAAAAHKVEVETELAEAQLKRLHEQEAKHKSKESFEHGAGGLQDIAGELGAGGLVGGAARAASGPAAAAAVLAGAYYEVTKAFAAAEAAQNGLDVALANSGQLIPEIRAQYSALADKLREETGQGFKGVLATLTEFGARAGDIQESAEAVKNLAGYTGDVNTASAMLAKALHGNFTAFQRLGLAIDDGLPQGEKLKRLYSELADMFGGRLEERNKTLAGSFNKIHEGWEHFLAGLGGSAGGKQVIEGVAVAMEYWAKAVEGVIPVQDALINRLGPQRRSLEDFEAAEIALAKATAARSASEAEANEELREESELAKDNATNADLLAKAELKRAEQQIKLAQETGAISKEEAAARLAELHDNFAEAQYQRDFDAHNKEIALLAKDVEERKRLASEAAATLAKLREENAKYADAAPLRHTATETAQAAGDAQAKADKARHDAEVSTRDALGDQDQRWSEANSFQQIANEEKLKALAAAKALKEFGDAAQVSGSALKTATEEYERRNIGAEHIKTEQLETELKIKSRDQVERTGRRDVERATERDAGSPALTGLGVAARKAQTESEEGAILKQLRAELDAERAAARAAVPGGRSHDASHKAIDDDAKKSRALIDHAATLLRSHHLHAEDLFHLVQLIVDNNAALQNRVKTLESQAKNRR